MEKIRNAKLSVNGYRPDLYSHPLIVVDDNEDDGQFLVQALEICRNPQQSIIEFRSGNDFLNFADELKSSYAHIPDAHEKIPDMIFLDLLMPGLTGQDVLKILRADSFWDDVPIMVSTQLHDDDVIYEIIQHGANGMLMKPYDKIEVLGALKKTNHFANYETQGHWI